MAKAPSPIVARRRLPLVDNALKKSAARVAVLSTALMAAQRRNAQLQAQHAQLLDIIGRTPHQQRTNLHASFVHWRMARDQRNRCGNAGTKASQNRFKLTCPECKALFSEAAHGAPVVRR